MRRWAAVLCVVTAGRWIAQAQDSGGEDLDTGKLLVADDQLRDPNFTQTVVLLVRYDDGGTVGLIINRQLKKPLSELFPDQAKAQHGSDRAYQGGPVEETGVLGLLRSDSKLDEASRVLGDLYVTSSKSLLEKTVSAGKEPGVFRVYLGYCGWAPGQLEMEMEAGAWHVFQGRSSLVFDAEPEKLWQRLFETTQMRLALRLSSSSSPAMESAPPIVVRFPAQGQGDLPLR